MDVTPFANIALPPKTISKVGYANKLWTKQAETLALQASFVTVDLHRQYVCILVTWRLLFAIATLCDLLLPETTDFGDLITTNLTQDAFESVECFDAATWICHAMNPVWLLGNKDTLCRQHISRQILYFMHNAVLEAGLARRIDSDQATYQMDPALVSMLKYVRAKCTSPKDGDDYDFAQFISQIEARRKIVKIWELRGYVVK
jgi:hypothetical protein